MTSLEEKITLAENNTTRYAVGANIDFPDHTGFFPHAKKHLFRNNLTKRCLICGGSSNLLFCSQKACQKEISRYLDLILHEPEVKDADHKLKNKQYIPCKTCGNFNFKKMYCNELCLMIFRDKKL